MLRQCHQISIEFCEPLGNQTTISGEFVVDGRPLRDHVQRAWKQSFDLISPLGWARERHQKEFAERLLLRREPVLPSGRREILVCPQCADLGCGCISADIEEDGEYFVWREFGHENDYEEESLSLIQMGTMVVAKMDLLHAIRGVVPGIEVA